MFLIFKILFCDAMDAAKVYRIYQVLQPFKIKKKIAFSELLFKYYFSFFFLTNFLTAIWSKRAYFQKNKFKIRQPKRSYQFTYQRSLYVTDHISLLRIASVIRPIGTQKHKT